MAKKKVDEKLRKKEYDKRRREKLKNDPVTKKEMQIKERIKYLQKKQKGQVKSVSELTRRELKGKRRNWKKSSKKYRKKKKEEKLSKTSEMQTLNELSMPSTSKSTSRLESGKKLRRKNRVKMIHEIQSLKLQLHVQKKIANKYKSKFYRMKTNTFSKDIQLTPRSKVHKLLGKERVSPAIRKRLIFGEALNAQLSETYKSLGQSHKKKQIFSKMVVGKITRKYRLIKHHLSFMKYKSSKTYENYINDCVTKYSRAIKESRIKLIKTQVLDFFENDENTRLCAGKKECITRNKIKHQKRFLNDTLRNLHKKFQTETGYIIGYSTFCRLKPFWVVKQSAEDRNTVKCIIHANMEFIVNKLKFEKLINCSTVTDVIDEICCNRYKSDCLLRKCSTCKKCILKFNDFDENKNICLSKWVYKNITYHVKGKEKSARKPEKVSLEMSVKELIKEFNIQLKNFLVHCRNIAHQYEAVKEIKASLSQNSILLHIDFSENFNCKFAEEIQAIHFGGNRQQVTLHTGIMYTKNGDSLIKHSFCTLSKSLRHDAAAVWAHLKSILKWALKINNQIKDVHILSDGPSSQYRNKKIFYLISNHLSSLLPQVDTCTWNFHEVGHGKGAPDGVGAILKQTADRVVGEGHDVENFEKFMSVLKIKCTGIKLKEVTEDEIAEIDNLLNNREINTFIGTRKVHQVTYADDVEYLFFRSLTCTICLPGRMCSHFHLGEGFKNISKTSQSQEVQDAEASFKCMDWIIVKYENKMYPGEILEINENRVKVNAMEPTGNGKFKWPIKEDIHDYPICDIVKKIEPPVPYDNRGSRFVFHEQNLE